MRRALLVCTSAFALLLGLTTAAAAATRADSLGPVGGPLLATHGTVVAPHATALPKVAAKSFVVADATTGAVLAARDPHGRFRPASTLKTLTALTLLPRLSPELEYTAVYTDAAAEGSRVGIVPDATYTVAQLFDGLFLPSGNDAAHALARAYGGLPKTVAAMNAEAADLQAYDTRAVNPSGLDADGQYTSAYDLALIARAGLARADFRSYTTKKVADFPGRMPKKPTWKRKTFKIYNQNRLLQDGYPGIVGVKTGYTTLAGRTFVAAAERQGHLVVVALMGIGMPSEDAARVLLNWSFKNLGHPGVGELVDPLSDTAPAATSDETPAANHVVAAQAAAGIPGSAASAPGGWVLGTFAAGALALLLAGGWATRARRSRSRAESDRLAAAARRAARG